MRAYGIQKKGTIKLKKIYLVSENSFCQFLKFLSRYCWSCFNLNIFWLALFHWPGLRFTRLWYLTVFNGKVGDLDEYGESHPRRIYRLNEKNSKLLFIETTLPLSLINKAMLKKKFTVRKLFVPHEVGHGTVQKLFNLFSNIQDFAPAKLVKKWRSEIQT